MVGLRGPWPFWLRSAFMFDARRAIYRGEGACKWSRTAIVNELGPLTNGRLARVCTECLLDEAGNT